jgi:biopolymer transport protein ExbD
MRYRPKEFGEEAGFDFTPMIDVSFQLIAFFMFSLNFSNADYDERIRLPASELARPSESLADRPLTLQITRDGRSIYGGNVYALAALRPRLFDEAEYLRRLDKSPADVKIIIRADADVQTGLVQEVIQICQDNQFTNFSLRVKQAEQRTR